MVTLLCHNPPSIANGNVTVTVNTTVPGTTAEYECENNFKRIGEAVISCDSTGFWTSKPPKCELDKEKLYNARVESKHKRNRASIAARLNMGGIIALGIFGGFVFWQSKSKRKKQKLKTISQTPKPRLVRFLKYLRKPRQSRETLPKTPRLGRTSRAACIRVSYLHPQMTLTTEKTGHPPVLNITTGITNNMVMDTETAISVWKRQPQHQGGARNTRRDQDIDGKKKF
ncbi:sushi, von Willebrand factor type A, EGF and pentraxin domain-containing protein 1 [Caerostris extrusa]|uniref:Sushi, von Willebrand factor type A, EGF and pentraxin domain-containing protein 1 n=1 Tax=Caerostris extrusa TaxID=172846 RepID=A0AAV4XDH5_CAEEX|nr:sushi, von Willebrand factor type A, EGF and pentraxin domain-containing protein 1 [Caerostris extrusa]